MPMPSDCRIPSRSWVRQAAIAAGLVGAAVSGCTRADGRVDVTGQVRWEGRPVPAGRILFTPETEQSNGRQGMAVIEQGRFTTRTGDGRGVIPGDYVAAVHLYDGGSPTEESPLGQRLAPPVDVRVTITGDGTPLASGSADIAIDP
jgi:hypothetical protein